MKRVLIIGIAVIFAVVSTRLYLRSARESEANIRASLLAQTPVGTSYDLVRSLAETNGWIGPAVYLNSYMVFPPGTNGIVVTSFGGRVRQDPFPYHTVVLATWEFDQSNRLFDIIVHRPGNE
jgi:hypothetical protein